MKKNVALLASVGLNVVLAAAVGLIATGAISLPSSPNPVASPFAANESARLVQTLVVAGLGDVESKQIVEVLHVQRETRPTTYRYWQAKQIRDAQDQIADLERSAKVRAGLLQSFGPGAKDDPAFARTFRPFDREYPMLTSDQQILLEGRNLQRLQAQDGQDPMMAVSRSSTPQDSLDELLNPAERLEYLLRESVLAKALTTSPFDFSEREFRAVFGVLAKSNPEIVMGATSLSVAEAISSEGAKIPLIEAIGQERYEALRRSRDPSYALIRRVAQMRGVSGENIDKAYALLINARPPKGDPATAKPPAELNALLGAPAASDVYRAFVYTRQSPAAGRTFSQPATRLPGRPTQLSPISQ